MRKLLLINTLLLGVLGLSCKKTGVPDVTPPSHQEIASVTLAGDYYVENTATSEFKIPVGTTTIANEARTINFTYTSTTGAAAGTQYTAPASITIPAGKALDTLRIKGLFAGYPAGRKDALKIKISGGSLPNFPGKDSFVLSLQRYCAVNLTALTGNYPNTTEPAYGPYTTSASTATSTGATSGTLALGNLFDDGWGAITATLDWASPAAFKVTIPIQSIGKSYGGIPAYVRTSTAASAVNTFSSCDNTITVSIDIVTSTGAVHPDVFGGTVTNYKIIMRKS
jgi:hypothetical protein